MLFEEDAYGEAYPLCPDWFEVRIDAPRDSDDGGVSQRTWRTGKPPCKEEEAPRGLRALREEWYRNRVEDSDTGKSRVKESGKYSFFIYLGSLLGPFTPISLFSTAKPPPPPPPPRPGASARTPKPPSANLSFAEEIAQRKAMLKKKIPAEPSEKKEDKHKPAPAGGGLQFSELEQALRRRKATIGC